jgi:hypothetical protein
VLTFSPPSSLRLSRVGAAPRSRRDSRSPAGPERPADPAYQPLKIGAWVAEAGLECPGLDRQLGIEICRWSNWGARNRSAPQLLVEAAHQFLKNPSAISPRKPTISAIWASVKASDDPRPGWTRRPSSSGSRWSVRRCSSREPGLDRDPRRARSSRPWRLHLPARAPSDRPCHKRGEAEALIERLFEWRKEGHQPIELPVGGTGSWAKSCSTNV